MGVEISQVQWAIFPLLYETPLLPAQLVALLEALALPTILRGEMASHLGHLQIQKKKQRFRKMSTLFKGGVQFASALRSFTQHAASLLLSVAMVTAA